MSFLKKLKDTFTVEGSGQWADAPIVVDETINMRILSARTVRARGHQPSTVDCPTCLALPGQRCGGLQRDVYHKPRLTAWKREELRERKAERKAVQKAAQEIVAKRDTSQPQPPMPSIDELARRAAYGELEMLQETITDEIVAQYGWSDADVLFLKGFGSICVVLAVHGEPPYPIRVTEKDAFVAASTDYISQRRQALDRTS